MALRQNCQSKRACARNETAIALGHGEQDNGSTTVVSACLAVGFVGAFFACFTPPVVEQVQQPLTTTVCNQGASDPVVVPQWGPVTTGAHPASEPLATVLRNYYAFSVTVRLELKARGLDGRIVTRTAWTGTVAGGQTRTVNVRPSEFPVQSVGFASAITLDAVIEQSGQPHLVGVRVPSTPLAARFTSDYLGVSLAGDDPAEASAIEPYTTAETFINQVSAVGRTLSTHPGRVWNGTAMVDVATLPVVSDEATRYRTLRTHTFSESDSLQWDKFLENVPPTLSPGDQDANGNRVCARISADFIDENRGEAVYGASFAGNGYPAAFALLSVFAADQNKLLWSGYASSDGCTPRLQGLASGRFVLVLESRLRDYRALPPAKDVQVDIGGKGNAFPSRQAIGFQMYSVSPAPPTDIRIRTDATDRRTLVLAALSQVLRTTTISIPSAIYPVRTSRCSGQDDSTTSFTACYSQPTLWLGQNRDPGRTHNAQWKFVVAHEFGHGIQANYHVAPLTDYSASVIEPACRCDHVFDDADRSHCMQSKENFGGVGNESYAHFVSTSVWSGSNPSSCAFYIYITRKHLQHPEQH